MSLMERGKQLHYHVSADVGKQISFNLADCLKVAALNLRAAAAFPLTRL